MWRIRIHATYKTGMKRICHTCVTNAFEICDEFMRIRANNSHVWKVRSVNIKVEQGLVARLHKILCDWLEEKMNKSIFILAWRPRRFNNRR